MKLFFVPLITILLLPLDPVQAADAQTAVVKTLKRAKYFGGRGYGYNDRSLLELSGRLTPADAPVLVTLLKNADMATGATFGLAALCADGMQALGMGMQADDTLPLDRARDAINLALNFDRCDPPARDAARALLPQLDDITAARQVRALAAQKAAQEELERNNINSLKTLDPAQRATLSHEERLEVFNSSVRSIGLDGTRTPEQEDLYQKMYKTMVENP